MFCNPNKKDNPLLWHVDGDGRHVFKWNSSMAESNNAFIAGAFDRLVTRVTRVYMYM